MQPVPLTHPLLLLTSPPWPDDLRLYPSLVIPRTSQRSPPASYLTLQPLITYRAPRSDGLKLYPTLVIRGTGLYELWKAGMYKNYHPDRLVDLVAR